MGQKVKSTPGSARGEKEKTTSVDLDAWSVTFEQFIANFLNEPVLVDYFDRKVDLMEGLRRLKGNRLRRADGKGSSADLEHQHQRTGGSVFYV